jgi:hypothetical protein
MSVTEVTADRRLEQLVSELGLDLGHAAHSVSNAAPSVPSQCAFDHRVLRSGPGAYFLEGRFSKVRK